MINSKFIQFEKHIVHKNRIIMIEQINHLRLRITTTALRNGENVMFETKYDFVKIGEELSEYLQSKKTILNK